MFLRLWQMTILIGLKPPSMGWWAWFPRTILKWLKAQRHKMEATTMKNGKTQHLESPILMPQSQRDKSLSSMCCTIMRYGLTGGRLRSFHIHVHFLFYFLFYLFLNFIFIFQNFSFFWNRPSKLMSWLLKRAISCRWLKTLILIGIMQSLSPSLAPQGWSPKTTARWKMSRPVRLLSFQPWRTFFVHATCWTHWIDSLPLWSLNRRSREGKKGRGSWEG